MGVHPIHVPEGASRDAAAVRPPPVPPSRGRRHTRGPRPRRPVGVPRERFAPTLMLCFSFPTPTSKLIKSLLDQVLKTLPGVFTR